MSWVYFIACGETMRVKIGYTTGSPYDRLKSLQTGSPTMLVLMALQRGGPDVERQLHKKFEKHRVRGEWFQMCEELFDHISVITLMTAMNAKEEGKPAPAWTKAGIESLLEHDIIPPEWLDRLQ